MNSTMIVVAVAVVLDILIPSPSMAGMSALGDPGPGNGWSSKSAISVRASSQHPTLVAENTINGAGIAAGGLMHSNTGQFISGPLTDSKANPRGGTVAGGHWIEFAFDQVYPLGEMWIWNYNSRAAQYDWLIQGFKNVTIQYSTTGGSKPEEWTTIFEGQIPMAVSPSPDFLSATDLKVDFKSARAKYVVITTADSPNHNWSEGKMPDAGLSEVRFFFSGPDEKGRRPNLAR